MGHHWVYRGGFDAAGGLGGGMALDMGGVVRVMRSLRLSLMGLIFLGVVACSQLSAGVSTVCADVAKLPVSVTAVLDASAPSSALGVLWADAKAGCANGVPAAGVSTDWVGMVWGEVKVLAPTLIPWLIGLL